MPSGWTKLWKALHRAKMKDELNKVFEHTLHQFQSWMKELNVHEDADIKRLLRCLDIFITTLATTLLACDYDRAILRAALDKTAYCISLDKLKSVYSQLIGKVFNSIQSQQQQQAAVVVPTAEVNLITTPPVGRSPVTVTTTAATPQSTAVVNNNDSAKEPTPAVPATSSNNNEDQQKRSRLCGNCGDVMTSAFHCNRCQARTYREVKCPACGQVNRDLKGYSCRFCYTNLLMHLTSEGKKGTENNVSSESPAPALTTEKPEKKKASRSKSSSSLMVSESGQHVVKTTEASSPSNTTSSTPPNNTPSSSKPASSTPSNSSPIIVQSSSDERSKVDVLGRTSDSESDDESKSASSRQRSPVVLKIKKRPARALSDSSSDEEGPTGSSKSPGDGSQTSPGGPPDAKRRHPDTNPSLTTRPGHTFRARGMSKSQRRILKNFKNVNNNSSSARNSKLMTSPPIWNRRPEFDVTECRRPGPLSRPSFYKIHKAWNIDLNKISLPDDFRGMDTFCKVTLCPYPEERMQWIYTAQPSLIEDFSDKILYG